MGPATGAGNEMAQWILKSNWNVVPQRILQSLHVDDIHSPEDIKKQEVFGALIERSWCTSITPPTSTKSDNDEQLEKHEDDDELARIVPDIKDSLEVVGRLINQQPAYNRLIHAEVQMKKVNDISHSKVT